MSIWFNAISLEDINARGQQTIVGVLGIVFTDVGDDYLVASMPVNDSTRQPLGILHGGASCVLAETIASTGANYVLDQQISYGVGLEINANHIRSVRSGLVYGTSTPLHLGRSTQVWQTEIKDEQARLICSSRMTIAVISRLSKA